MLVLRKTDFRFAVLVSVAAAVLFIAIESHPQCLDYGAPFNIEKKLNFCLSYGAYGCCSHKQNSLIALKYREIMSNFQLSNQTKCAGMLREVLCLECHPYAAHIFASEGNRNFDISSATPGLCGGFCKTFFQSCSRVILEYFWGTGKWVSKSETTSFLNRNRSINGNEFCHSIKLSDQDYCYPHVQTVDKRILERKYNKGTNKGCICAERVDSNLRNPLAAMHAGDGTNRFFVAEQLGVVHVYLANGVRLRNPFLDIKEKVLTTSGYGDERGFLGLAFHPHFASNGRVFVYYSARIDAASNIHMFNQYISHKSVLSEYRISAADPNRVNHTSEKIIMEVDQPEDNHNGGMLMFGLDGYLYLSLGDGGSGGDPFGEIGNGLNRSTLLGSIIRIDVNTDGNVPYKIPPDNPFVNMTGVRPEIYAYGARNMWRCSIDRGDKTTGEGRGRMFCGDVGQNQYEEIDIITKGGNYGWRAYEGNSCYDRDLCKGKLAANAIPPIFNYSHSVGKSVVGGYVYRGCRNPNLYGKYIFADTMTGEMFQLTENKTQATWKVDGLCLGDSKYCTDGLVSQISQFILSFGEDEQGELYVLATDLPSAGLPKGSVYRLVDPARRGDPTKCKSFCEDRAPPSISPIPICVRYKKNCNRPTWIRFLRKWCQKTCNLC